MATLPDLTDMARDGAQITVRVTPKAARDEVRRAGAAVSVRVTALPEGGRANEAVRKLLAKALGVAKSRLTLVRGQTARDKTFRLDL
ncbi:DUF167 domain-containing protein [Pseudooceanicola sp.]|jgi:uncharacterized protein YggU (UPF0235/DUF167 family)|uniref:DUF167 domain-containing protein n=1 Tax=Pseudooceanicola sp. TaxID=1914328 RepID=UPI0040583F54